MVTELFMSWDFPGGPVVKILSFQCKGPCHVVWTKKKKRKAEPYSCSNHGDLKDARTHTHTHTKDAQLVITVTSHLIYLFAIAEERSHRTTRVICHLIGLSCLKDAITQERKSVQTLHCSQNGPFSLTNVSSSAPVNREHWMQMVFTWQGQTHTMTGFTAKEQQELTDCHNSARRTSEWSVNQLFYVNAVQCTERVCTTAVHLLSCV